MSDNRPGYLKERFAFDDWCGRNRMDASFFVSRFFISGRELDGWTLSAANTAQLPGWPRFSQTVWQRSLVGGNEALRLDFYECASRAAAHEFLVTHLAQFQLAGMQRSDQLPVGDVGFADASGQQLLFARGNLVILMSCAEGKLRNVADMARRFDAELCAEPANAAPLSPMTEATTRDVTAAAAAAERYQVDDKILLDLSAFGAAEPAPHRAAGALSSAERAGPSRAFKLFSTSGEFSAEDDRLVFQPAQPGAYELRIFAVGERGDASYQIQRFAVD